jgi:hypothetical protein
LSNSTASRIASTVSSILALSFCMNATPAIALHHRKGWRVPARAAARRPLPPGARVNGIRSARSSARRLARSVLPPARSSGRCLR